MKKRFSILLLLIVICFYFVIATATTPPRQDFPFTLQNNSELDITRLDVSYRQESWGTTHLRETLPSGESTVIDYHELGGMFSCRPYPTPVVYVRITDSNGSRWIFRDVELTINSTHVFSFNKNGEGQLN